MIKTIPLDIFINLLVGESIAYASLERIKKGEPLFGTGMLSVILLVLLTFIPFALFYLIAYLDWSWMYFFDPAELPGYSIFLVPVAYLLAGCIGYWLSWGLIRIDSIRGAQTLMVITGLILFLLSVIYSHRLFMVGNYAEYHSGMGGSLFKDRLLWVIITMGAIFLPAWSYTLMKLRGSK